MARLHRQRHQLTLISRQTQRFEVLLKGSLYSPWRDPYHLLLTINWFWFLGLIMVSYFATNALFALLYLIGENNLENARPGSFWDAFFFSVQTMATIGYGAISPSTFYANILVTLEALVGLLGVAMATGLMFARFSRPTARVIFSRIAVITLLNGLPTLIFRTANKRQSQILEAQIRVSLLRDEVTAEGEFMRRFYDLKLVRSQSSFFALSWTVMHQIDESSPLYGATPEFLAQANAELAVSLTGLDETVSQTIHARHFYTDEDILWNRRFVDIILVKPDGQRIVDYALFHEVMPE